MGFLDRLRTPEQRTEPLVFSAVEEHGRYKARDGLQLWRNGFALVDDFGRFLSWDAPEITGADSMICRVAGVSHRARDLQRKEFSPGHPLVLRPEPENPYDPNAVGAWDQSGRVQIGFLPREKAPGVAASFRRRQPKAAMVLQELRKSEDGERVSLVILIHPLGPVQLELEEGKPAPDEESSTPKRRRDPDGPGMVRGWHFTEWVEAVKELRRRGDEPAAQELLLQLVDATEAEARVDGYGVAPWYYEQLAISYRKGGELEKEVAILERYATQRHAPGASPPKLLERLEKAKQRLGRQ